jgi:hypothetical protein
MPALHGARGQESGSLPGVAHFTVNPDDAATEVCGAMFGMTGPERGLGASGTLTISRRDGEIKLRIGPPFLSSSIAYLDKQAHPSCTHFVVGVSTTRTGRSYE